MNNQNPPIKKMTVIENENNFKEKSYIKKIKRKKKKKLKKDSVNNENPITLNSTSMINLKSHSYLSRNVKKSLFSNNDIKIEDKPKIIKDEKMEEKKIESKLPTNNKMKYIDEELNIMNYNNALENDKRNYWQYYWSLLKKKHLIILTFISNDDYNVFLLKFSLFILSLGLFFSLDTLFFKESTIHIIFTQQGRYDLIYQIPQVLYSTLISFAMTLILKRLSLSQSELITIKKEIDQVKAKKLATKSKKCMKNKLYIFFLVGIILLLFFWYYISAFGAVYKNTQLHLIKDTLISFGISMVYPFLINFIPFLY